MNLGLIARADNSGLGVQSWEFHRHMNPAKTMVIDVSREATGDTVRGCSKDTDLSRYPADSIVVDGWVPSRAQVDEFLDGLDVVFTMETPYYHKLYDLACERGIKTVLQYNWEFLDAAYQPTLLAAPTTWHYDDVHARKMLLPVPIATDRFPYREMNTPARRFLHVAGRPATLDRNGTMDLLRALRFVHADIELTIATQLDGGFSANIAQARLDGWLPPNVTVRRADTREWDYWEIYRRHDVLVLPRRYGGLCLPAQEAIGAGMPVIMPAISPNIDWLPPEWLVPAARVETFRAKRKIDVYSANLHHLAERIELFADSASFMERAVNNANNIARKKTWDAMKFAYRQTLEAL